jgi:hypothetical protein
VGFDRRICQFGGAFAGFIPSGQSPEPLLPSPRTFQHGATVGMLPSQEFPFSYRGLPPHKLTPMLGAPSMKLGYKQLGYKFVGEQKLKNRHFNVA